MAEVSVLSPSSNPSGPAGVIVDSVSVDVNIEDVAGIGAPTLMETDSGGGGRSGAVLPKPVIDTDKRMQQSPDQSVEGTPTGVSSEATGTGQSSPCDVTPRAVNKRRSTEMQQTDEAEAEGDPDCQSSSKKKRHRRKNKGGKHHRKWKPYSKLTWEEKRVLEERESRRAVQKRQQMAACGQPMAPYNTTQFLMEQHEPEDADISLPLTRAGRSEGSGSMESSDEYYDSPNDEQEIFLEKDFTEAYESFHAERLQAMSKDELVREHLELESKVEKLECRLKDLGENNRENASDSKSGSGESESSLLPAVEPKTQAADAIPEMSAASKLRLEIQRLREENSKLVKENQELKATKTSS